MKEKYSLPGSAILFFLLLFSPGLLFAEKPPEGSGWNYLEKKTLVTHGPEVVLLPEFSGRKVVLDSITENNPVTSIEMLYQLPLPPIAETETDLRLFIFNQLNKFSTMEGLEYYSSRKGGMVPYLAKSFVVSKKGSKKPLPDPLYEKLPESIRYVLYQKDTVFGSNWYNVDVRVFGDALWLKMTNVSAMKFYIFPLLPPGGLTINMVIVPRKDKLLFYAVSQLQEEERKTILGIGVYLPGAFDHRISAMEGWFARQVYPNPVPGRIQ